MFEQTKVAVGEFMGRYYSTVVPTTLPVQKFMLRGLSNSILWAPSRMIDSVEEMLSQYMRADLDGEATTPPEMPVMFVSMAKDFTPTGRDFTRQIADTIKFSFPEDPKGRVFGLRTVAGDLRVQVVIVSTDEPSAKSLAAQFGLFLDATPNRKFDARYSFAGQVEEWPIVIESPDSPGMSIQTESKNLTILAIDLNLHATVPLFSAPGIGQPNDGKGEPGTDDPAGYPVVIERTIKQNFLGMRGRIGD